PVGRQIELRGFPVNVAVHPDGRYAAVLHSGYSANQVCVVDLLSGQANSHVTLAQAFYGLEFSRDGQRLFCSGAGEEVVHAFDFQNGSLENHREIKLRDRNERGVPAGLAVNSSARQLFAANVWGDRISRVELLPEPKVLDIPLRTNQEPVAKAADGPVEDLDTAAANKRA